MVEERGLTPTKEVLKKLGGWPVLEDDFDEENFDWKETVYKFRKEGFSVDYIFDFSINIDLKNSTFRVIDVIILLSIFTFEKEQYLPRTPGY